MQRRRDRRRLSRSRHTGFRRSKKTRASEDFGRPIAAVDRQKQKRISRGGLNWLRMLDNPDILFRFDVVEVIVAEDARPRLELIKTRSRCPSLTFIEVAQVSKLRCQLFAG
jgi:Holliday junction resolvase-like predicted endonuclease